MTERLPRKFSRVFATAVAAAGAAVLGLALVLPPVGGGEWFATIRGAAAFVGGALFVAGAAIAYLSVSRQPLLPNERVERSADPSAGSWLVLPALVLAASTTWMFSRLPASISLWRDIITGLDRLNVWQGMWDAPQFSGYYLAPLGLVVAAPALQALTAAVFAAAAFVVLLLMLFRNSRLPRVFLIAVLWLAALVFIGGVATTVAARAIPVVEQEIRRLPDPDGEGARWLPQIRRYGDATQSASRTLMVTWAAWALLLPVLAWSDRAARTSPPSGQRRSSPSIIRGRPRPTANATSRISREESIRGEAALTPWRSRLPFAAPARRQSRAWIEECRAICRRRTAPET